MSAGAIGNDKIDVFSNKIQSILVTTDTSGIGPQNVGFAWLSAILQIQKFNFLGKQDKRAFFQLQNAK